MKRSITLSLAALLMATSLGVVAGHHDDNGDKGRGMHQRGSINKALWQLDLSDEQRDEIKTIFKQFKEEHKAMREAKREAGDESQREQYKAAMKALMDAPEFDETAAKALIAEREQKQTERQLRQMRHRHQLMQVLTAEQREQLSEIHNERGDKRRNRN